MYANRQNNFYSALPILQEQFVLQHKSHCRIGSIWIAKDPNRSYKYNQLTPYFCRLFQQGQQLILGHTPPPAAIAAAADKVKGFITVELNMGQMIEDVRLYSGCKKPVTLCSRTGGMIVSPEEVLESIRKAEKGEF